MFLHIPNGIFLFNNFVSYNLMLTETPIRKLTAREFESLGWIYMDQTDLQKREFKDRVTEHFEINKTVS